MSEVAFIIGLMIWHLVLAIPALFLLWKLRRRVNARSLGGRSAAALIGGVWIAPTFLDGHFPLIVPLVFSYLGSGYLGVPFHSWNLFPAAIVALVILIFWPMRSNSTAHPDARGAPPS